MSSLRVELNQTVLDSSYDGLKAVIIVESEGAHLLIQDSFGEAVLMADLEVQTLRAMTESYEKSIQLYQKNKQLEDQKYNTLIDQNDKLSIALVESRRSSDLQKILWFGLGVLTTGFAVYGAKKITQ